MKPTDLAFWALILLWMFGIGAIVQDQGPWTGLVIVIAATLLMVLLLPVLRREREDAEDALRRRIADRTRD